MEQGAGKKIKRERTTSEQLSFYIKFCRQHPEIQPGKNKSKNPNVTEKLFQELADSLNKMRGPTRTSTRWKESLAHWRNQVKSRARKLNCPSQTSDDEPLSYFADVESHTLRSFEANAIDEIPVVSHLDIEPSGSSDIKLASPIDIKDETMSLSSRESACSTVSCSLNISKRMRKRTFRIEDGVKEMMQSLQNRQKRDDEVLKNVQEMNATMKTIAAAISIIVNKLSE